MIRKLMKRLSFVLMFLPVNSAAAQCGWIFQGTGPKPILTPPPGTYYQSSLTISVSNLEPGAVLYLGCANGYVSGSTITLLGWSVGTLSVVNPDGSVYFEDIGPYVLQSVAPVFSPAGGTVSSGQAVTITASPTSTIYYTTDGTVPTVNSGLPYFEPITVKVSETIRAIAVDGQDIPSASVSGSYTVTPPPPVQLLDPSPLDLADPTQSLMSTTSPTSVTTVPEVLGTYGRPVQGVAADGTAEVVLRIPVNTAGDKITATVLNDQCSVPSDPSTCTVSTDVGYDGGLTTLTTQSNPITAQQPQSAVGDSNKFAYLIYRAPHDFVRWQGPSSDGTAMTRPIEFRITYATAGGVQYATQYASLTVIRPPVVLIHGYASDAADTWGSFGTVSTQTQVYEVDYGYPYQVASINPSIQCLPNCGTLIKRSDLGVSFNTPTVAIQTVLKLRDFAGGDNPAKISVSVSQADIVAHSMGGLIARSWSTDATVDAFGAKARFRTGDNYNQGYIHKLITIGTPYFGSPLATESLSPRAGCFRQISSMVPRFMIGTAVLVGQQGVAGAVGDLDGDGLGTRVSPTLQTINSSAASLPTYTIAGNVTPAILGPYQGVLVACDLALPALLEDPFLFPLVADPVASRMFNASTYGWLFDPALTPSTEWATFTFAANDGAVPVTSALQGRGCTGFGADCFVDAHGENTRFFIGATRQLLGDPQVLNLVQGLLNTSVDDTFQWVKQ